ncbi:uncharacterized protein [Temnothorax nylanderi]|uniref:uncharacterized protein isoform X1 n=1 Tax=Temnothorax nylanderi TaxID=102681 RepID=UPI003A8C6841
MVSSDSESDDVFGIPEKIAEAAKNVEQNLLPTKSKSRYETTYLTFMNWRKEKNINSFSENVLLAYISELSKKTKPSTLWSQYSMLKSTLIAKQNVNIHSYSKLTAFLKRKSNGFKSKKSKVFTSNEIQKFLNEAPDDQYLATKVALIVGIAGACRGNELTKLNVENIEHHGSLLLIKIPDTKTKILRSYTIEGKFAEIVKKYEALRPQYVTTNRFFLNFQKGKCTTQVIGKNKIARMPKEIASYLNLLEPELYTSHSFRRTSATLLADTGAGITTIKRHSGWKSTSVAEKYIKKLINNKRNIANLITSSINLHETIAKQNPESEEPPIKQSKLGINVNASTSKSSDCIMIEDKSKSTFKIKKSRK